MANDIIIREALLSMLKAGQITQSEAARLAGRSRQSVREWLDGFDTTKARAEYLKRKLDQRVKARS